MTFDPFGDFATRGYLRNHAALQDPAKIKRLEHGSFLRNVEPALHGLKGQKELSFSDVKAVHKQLFSDVYPWAGEDRSRNAADLNITKGPVVFMPAPRVEMAANYALKQAGNPDFMRANPGQVLGNLAYAHPFLDGNGRTIMTVHAELCRRADIHIDWSRTDKSDYLNALTNELDDPDKNHLDAYLKQHVRQGSIDLTQTAKSLRELPGLGPDEKLCQDATPELQNAGKLEKYIERKLQQQFPEDAQAVARGVAVAREKIAELVEKGFELPTPSVNQTRAPGEQQTNQPRDSNLDREREK